MFWFLTKKQAKKEFKKIGDSFNKFKSEITELTSQSLNNRVLIEKNKDDIKEFISKKEIDLMIREALIKEAILGSSQTIPQTPRTQMRKKADKMLNRAEILSEMANLSNKGYSTQEMFNIIVNQKQIIKKTCFYKYLKKIREQFARTPQTN